MYRPPRAPPSVCSLQCLVALMLGLYVVLFVVSRVHILHEAYAAGVQSRDDESWLLQQCEKHEFYHNMKQHSGLCDEVKSKHNSILFLDALQHVVNNTYMCGYEPCSVFVTSVIDWALGRGAMITLWAAGIMLVLPTLFVPVWRRFLNTQADYRMHQLYHKPYGEQHYIQSHEPPHIYRALE